MVKSNLLLILFIDKQELKEIVQSYFDRMLLCEGQKWDLEHEVRKKEYEVTIETKILLPPNVCIVLYKTHGKCTYDTFDCPLIMINTSAFAEKPFMF